MFFLCHETLSARNVAFEVLTDDLAWRLAGVFIVRDVPNAGNAFRRDVAGRLSAPKLQQPVLPCPARHDILP